LHSLRLRQLVLKEWRELFASRAYWLLLLLIGPLVGQAFISAIMLYAEASGSGTGPAALSQGLTPLDGILVPTFGAYDLAATFFLPFVAIRLIASEKQSGALKLLLQLPGSLSTKVTVKGIVLMAGWLLTFVPGLVAIVLWKSYGGHLYAPEALNLFLGHFLRSMLSVSIAVAAAALTESSASAAIVTLGFTVGSWALDFVAAGRGGRLQQLANYTPTAALRFFEQGLLRLSTAFVIVLIVAACFALTVIWLHIGQSLRRRALASIALLFFVVVAAAVAGNVRTSWDLTENRRNSFSRADEAALQQIKEPLHISVNLAPEDPRLTDFEQNILKKLRRSLAEVKVDYSAGSQTGLFEGAEDRYGEIWYEMRGQKVMDRSTIEPVVLEQIYKLAGVTAPAPEENDFPGYPLATGARGAAWIFYGIWPALTLLFWWLIRRERN
jgi:ABC-2 type transport system permease protein